jgi:hypothetical protein
VSLRGYGLKRWWRESRELGESLKAFARRFAGFQGQEPTTTSAGWLVRKGARQSAIAACMAKRAARDASC